MIISLREQLCVDHGGLGGPTMGSQHFLYFLHFLLGGWDQQSTCWLLIPLHVDRWFVPSSWINDQHKVLTIDHRSSPCQSSILGVSTHNFLWLGSTIHFNSSFWVNLESVISNWIHVLSRIKFSKLFVIALLKLFYFIRSIKYQWQ